MGLTIVSLLLSVLLVAVLLTEAGVLEAQIPIKLLRGTMVSSAAVISFFLLVSIESIREWNQIESGV